MTSIALLNVGFVKASCHISSNQGIGKMVGISCSGSSSRMTNCSIGKLSSRRKCIISAPRPCIQGQDGVFPTTSPFTPSKSISRWSGRSESSRQELWHDLGIGEFRSVGLGSRLILDQRWGPRSVGFASGAAKLRTPSKVKKNYLYFPPSCDRICLHPVVKDCIRQMTIYTLSLHRGTTMNSWMHVTLIFWTESNASPQPD